MAKKDFNKAISEQLGEKGLNLDSDVITAVKNISVTTNLKPSQRRGLLKAVLFSAKTKTQSQPDQIQNQTEEDSSSPLLPESNEIELKELTPSKSDKTLNNLVKHLKDDGTIELNDKATRSLDDVEKQRIQKLRYKLSAVGQKSFDSTVWVESTNNNNEAIDIPGLVKFTKEQLGIGSSNKEGKTNNEDKQKFMRYVYKFLAKRGGDLDIEAQQNLVRELELFQTLSTIGVDHGFQASIAKAMYSILTHDEFKTHEREAIRIQLAEVLKHKDQNQKERNRALINLIDSIPLAADGHTGLKTILHYIPGFKSVKDKKNTADAIYTIIEAFAGKKSEADEDDKLIFEHLRSATGRERIARWMGKVSAVIFSLGCAFTTGAFLWNLQGIPFILGAVGIVALAGFVSNIYVLLAYAPGTWAQLLRGLSFKSLSNTRKLIAAIGVTASITVAVLISAITWVAVNFAMLKIFTELGLITLGTHSLTFVAAATPWVIAPAPLLFATALAISTVIGLGTGIAFFTCLARDYVDKVREFDFDKLKIALVSFYSIKGKFNAAQLAKSIFVTTAVLGVLGVVFYYAILPTAFAWGGAVPAIFGAFGVTGLLIEKIGFVMTVATFFSLIPFYAKNVSDVTLRLINLASDIVKFVMSTKEGSALDYLKHPSKTMQAAREMAGVPDHAGTLHVIAAVIVAGLINAGLFFLVIANAVGNGVVSKGGSAALGMNQNAALAVGSAASSATTGNSVFAPATEDNDGTVKAQTLAQKQAYKSLITESETMTELEAWEKPSYSNPLKLVVAKAEELSEFVTNKVYNTKNHEGMKIN